MDNICEILEKLLRMVDRKALPRIPYVGWGGGRVYNPPAPHIEIVYAVGGDWDDLFIGDRCVSLPAGHMSVQNVHFGNYSESYQEGRSAWCIFFDVQDVKEFECMAEGPCFGCVQAKDGQGLVNRIRETQARFLSLLGPACRYPDDNNPYCEKRLAGLPLADCLWLKASLMELISFAAKQAGGEGLGRPAMPDAVCRALELAGARYQDERLCLEDMADAANLSVDHFGRVFREALGVSPMIYLQRLRVGHASTLLSHTAMLVEEVAREVGFTDQFYFSRVFKKHAGQSPSEFRQKAER